MAGLEGDTKGGFNAFIEKQSQIMVKTMLTAVHFDDKYELLWDGISIEDVRLTNREYFVRGSTALLDAIGKKIK